MPPSITVGRTRGVAQGPIPFRIPVTDPLLLLPDTTMVRGTSCTVKPTATGARWNDYWVNWDWSAWVKPQIDAAASVGANVIRQMGSVRTVSESHMTLATMLTRWDQLIDYCETLGLYVYACFADYWSDFGGNGAIGTALSASVISDHVAACAEHLHDSGRWERIIGIDLMNEGGRDWGTATAGVECRNAVGQVTNLPLAVSTWGSSGDLTQFESAGIRDTLAGRFDFLDWHWYSDPAATYADTNHWAHYPDLPLLLGEFGANQSETSGARTARYTAVKALVDDPGPSGQRLAGACQWAITDQSATTSDQWGMFDASFVERTELTDIFTTFPTST